MLAQRDRSNTRRNRGRARSDARRWILPTVGALTPVCLIVVNIAAFIVHQLQTFRLMIGILAFVSGVMLNSWAGLALYRGIKARAPDARMIHQRNHDVLIIGGMGVILLLAAGNAWFCYQGLASDKDLPNLSTFLVGVVAILFPIGLRAVAERMSGETIAEDL